jgi:phospholipase/carboxylesterase
MAHGTEDAVIPFEMAAKSRDVLTAHGYDVEWHEYPMPHSVCLEEIQDVASWMKRVLGS